MATKNTAEKQETAARATAAEYTKAQILASARYVSRRDLLGVLLKDSDKYSLEQVNELVDEFMKGKVK